MAFKVKLRSIFTLTQRGAPSPRQAGFTVIEIILVTFIATITIATLLRFLSLGHPLARITYLQSQSTETARLQLKRLASVLREVRPSDTGAYPLVETSPQQIIFYANIDGDPATERVRYELQGTDLYRGITKPTGNPIGYDVAQENVTVVARSIRNGADPVFTYYTGEYPTNPSPLPAAETGSARYIQFRLLIDVDPAVDPLPVEVVSQVQLRNLKNNLAEGG